MFEKIVEYCKNNLAIAAIVAACVLLILISIVALCVKKSQVKKAKSVAKEEPKQTAIHAPQEKPAPTAKTEAAPTKEPAKKIDENNAPKETTEKKTEKQPTPQESPKATAPKTNETAETKQAATKSETKPVAKEKPLLPQPKKATPKTGRYSGKWVICRVVTAAHAEGNIHDEAADEMYFFELRASNGEKLLTSEEYTTYAGAVSGIATHKANIEKNNFRITLSKKGDYIFKLLNGKNMLLCMGEHYATRVSCESAIESAKRFAKTAVIDENVQDIVIPTPADDEEEIVLPENDNIHGKWIVHSNVAEDGETVFYFELYASNGEKLLSSEEYTTYTGAVNGIETHKTNIERGNFRVAFTKRGDYIYKLLNGNNQLLCLGEHYKTRRRCENAIESVKRFSKVSPVLTDSNAAK